MHLKLLSIVNIFIILTIVNWIFSFSCSMIKFPVKVGERNEQKTE